MISASTNSDPAAAAAAAAVPADAVFRLVYRSRSRIEPARSALALSDILSVARSKNAALGITGALMLYQDWFAQVLEGDEARVRALFATIRSDGRHGSVQLTEQLGGMRRAFPRWAMAHVGEHGQPDAPQLATPEGTTTAAPWRLSDDQEKLVAELRNLTRGYGIGS